MVRGVEPQIDACQANRLYPSHARLGFIRPLDYEYTFDRTFWQSLKNNKCLLAVLSPRPFGRHQATPNPDLCLPQKPIDNYFALQTNNLAQKPT
jgi:hypothetical protein